MQGKTTSAVSRRPAIFPFMPQSPDACMVEAQRLDAAHAVRRMGSHGHTFFELILITAGQGWHTINGHRHAATRGSLAILAPGDIHDCSSLGSAAGWILLFGVEALDPAGPGGRGSREWALVHPLLSPFAIAARTRAPAVTLSDPQVERWVVTLERIEHELSERAAHYAAAITAALQLLLVDLSREIAGTSGVAIGATDNSDAVERALRYIDSHALSDITPARVARHAGRSLAHLTTDLRRKSGLTLGQWIAAHRMAEARRMLVETDLSSDEIAYRVRYSDADALARAFRRIYGVSPAAWRRVHR